MVKKEMQKFAHLSKPLVLHKKKVLSFSFYQRLSISVKSPKLVWVLDSKADSIHMYWVYKVYLQKCELKLRKVELRETFEHWEHKERDGTGNSVTEERELTGQEGKRIAGGEWDRLVLEEVAVSVLWGMNMVRGMVWFQEVQRGNPGESRRAGGQARERGAYETNVKHKTDEHES